MLLAQFLCELRALLSVASALRSVHRRHHWLKVIPLWKTMRSWPAFQSLAPELHHEIGNQRLGAAFRWRAAIKCEGLRALL
jgi:hypothetical protein